MTDDRARDGTRGRRKGRGTDEAEQRHDGRVVPHNLDAEESVLGAMLLSTTAIGVVDEFALQAGDFYKPAYGHVYATIVELYQRGEPADPVTVADALKRAGLLDAVGGPTTLLTLQATCPATSNAKRYATIIREHAVMRGLISAGAELAELGFSTPDDVHAAVLKAGQITEAVAANNGARSYSSFDVADVAELLNGDLDPVDPDLLARVDGKALLYAGKMHVLQAEPSSGKTWIALAAVVEVLNLGGAVVYLDYEDTARGILGRLLAVGAEPAAVRERFVYVQPAGGFGAAEKMELDRLLQRVNPDLIVIDGVAEALMRDGYSEDSNADLIAWVEKMPRPLSRTGAAVLMLDHVKKDPESRGRYARGASAKLAVVDGASYEVRVVTSFSRHREGLVKLIIAKDRPGGVGAIGEVAAMVKIVPKADGARVLITLEANSEEVRVTDSWKPTVLMEKVSLLVRSSQVPLTASTVKTMVHAEKPKLVTEAISRLLVEGFLKEEKSGRAKVLKSLRPYTAGGLHAVHEPPPPDEPPPGLWTDEELDHDPYADADVDHPDDEPPSNVTPGPWTREAWKPYDGEDF